MPNDFYRGLLNAALLVAPFYASIGCLAWWIWG